MYTNTHQERLDNTSARPMLGKMTELDSTHEFSLVDRQAQYHHRPRLSPLLCRLQ